MCPFENDFFQNNNGKVKIPDIKKPCKENRRIQFDKRWQNDFPVILQRRFLYSIQFSKEKKAIQKMIKISEDNKAEENNAKNVEMKKSIFFKKICCPGHQNSIVERNKEL